MLIGTHILFIYVITFAGLGRADCVLDLSNQRAGGQGESCSPWWETAEGSSDKSQPVQER